MDIHSYRTDIQNLITEIGNMRGVNPQRTIELCDKLESYGERRKEDGLIGFACFTRGETYYLMNDMPNFYHEILACMQPLERIREWGYLAMANNMLGIMFVNRGNAPFALDYYFKAISYCRDYKLPDLECAIHMNIGSLYLNVQNFEEALVHYKEGYKYINEHPKTEGFIEKLTAICVGLGKTHLAMEDLKAAKSYDEILKNKCLPHMVEADKLVIYCFEARLSQKLSNPAETEKYITFIQESLSEDVPIMDVFDDVYDYLTLLQEEELWDEFLLSWKKLIKPTQKTTVKNLECKMLSLMIQYHRINEQVDSYAQAAMKYYEMTESMQRENEMMISGMISMRHHLYELTKTSQEEKKRIQYLIKKSETDPLTGMHNRLKLNEYAEVAFDRAKVNEIGLGIELLDIDYFKEYNDNYGHQAGDECLLFIAKCLKQLGEEIGVFCSRYGGDEFVIIYEGYTEQETFALAKQLKASIVEAAYAHEYTKLSNKIITISQGIFWGVPQEDETVWEYLKEADQLLYKVKQKSRNGIMLGRERTNLQEESGTQRDLRPIISEV